jgi:hypothetical protein
MSEPGSIQDPGQLVPSKGVDEVVACHRTDDDGG